MNTTLLRAYDETGRNTLFDTFNILTADTGTLGGYFPSVADIQTFLSNYINTKIEQLQTLVRDFDFNEGDTVVVYDENDPANCTVLEVAKFAYEDSAAVKADISAAIDEAIYTTAIKFTTPIGVSFSKEAAVKIYKAVAFGAGVDAKTEYYTLQFVQLDAQTKAPRILDVWKVSVDAGATLSYTPTDFVNFDLVFNSSYPSVTDTEAGGALFGVRAEINGKFPLFRMVDVPSNFKV
jgi:hypothetical protein